MSLQIIYEKLRFQLYQYNYNQPNLNWYLWQLLKLQG